MASTNVSLDDIDLSSLRVSYVLIFTSTEWKYLKKKQKARRIYICVQNGQNGIETKRLII